MKLKKYKETTRFLKVSSTLV